MTFNQLFGALSSQEKRINEDNSLLGKRKSTFVLSSHILQELDQSFTSHQQQMWDRSRRPKLLQGSLRDVPNQDYHEESINTSNPAFIQDYRNQPDSRQTTLQAFNPLFQRTYGHTPLDEKISMRDNSNTKQSSVSKNSGIEPNQNMDLWTQILNIPPDATKDYISRKWLIRTMKDYYKKFTGYDSIRMNEWLAAGASKVDSYHIKMLEKELTPQMVIFFKKEDLQSAAKIIRHLVIRANYRQEKQIYDEDYQIGQDIIQLLSKFSQEKIDTLLIERGFLIIVLAFVCTKAGMDYNQMRCEKDKEKSLRWMKVFAELKFKAINCLYEMLPPQYASMLPLKNGNGGITKNQAMLDFCF